MEVFRTMRVRNHEAFVRTVPVTAPIVKWVTGLKLFQLAGRLTGNCEPGVGQVIGSESPLPPSKLLCFGWALFLWARRGLHSN